MISNNLIFDSGYLEVDKIHKIYYEQFGNPTGKPILFLHGGPGAGFSDFHKNFFDKNKYRVIFVDQRGSGKSKPYAETKKNNTQELLNDLELIRKYLKIDKWLIFGGSWGSTLALSYGINFPDNCSGFFLRGVFLGTKEEINWFLYDMKKFFPEAYSKFVNNIPLYQRKNILSWFNKELKSKEKNKYYKAASIWNEYESSCSTLRYVERKNSGEASLAIAKIEVHYFINNCFLTENYIMDNLDKILHLPCVIVQGRHDVICPPFNAFSLSQSWKNCKIDIVEDGAHSAFEKNMFEKIIVSLSQIY